MKVAFGEFDWPNNNASVARMRSVFLDAIREQVPAVLEHLYIETFSIYKMFARNYPGAFWHQVRYSIDHPSRPAAGLMASLYRWSQRWNLNAEWCRERAYETLKLWEGSKPSAELLWQSDGWGGAMPSDTPPPPEGLPEYRPLDIDGVYYLDMIRTTAIETIKSDPILKHAKIRTRQQFVDSILAVAKTYYIKVENHYDALGYKRSAEKKQLPEHLRWTVKFQIQGQSYNAIARESNVSTSTVMRGVADILSLVQLNPRASAKPGRQPGRKDSSDTRRQREKKNPPKAHNIP